MGAWSKSGRSQSKRGRKKLETEYFQQKSCSTLQQTHHVVRTHRNRANLEKDSNHRANQNFSHASHPSKNQHQPGPRMARNRTNREVQSPKPKEFGAFSPSICETCSWRD